MRWTRLHSLPLAAAFAAQALPHVLAAGSFTPIGSGLSETVSSENQKLYISGGGRYISENFQFTNQFVSLDLSVAWTSDAPAWSSLTLRPTDQLEFQGTMALAKDHEYVLFFSNTAAYKYNTKTNDWDKDSFMNFTYPAFDGGAITDTDSGLMYGIELWDDDEFLDKRRFTEWNPVTKNYTSVDIKGHPDPKVWTSMVYSSATKTIFGYEDASLPQQPSLVSYNIKTKAWSLVNATGDIPPVRQSPCFVSAYGGKKLIVAGGQNLDLTAVYKDVYIFDVETSVWSKLADAPRAARGPVCAASNDAFIFWGGLGISTSSDEGPAILDITTNTWGKSYTPPGHAPMTPLSSSSADRAHMVLAQVGLVGLTVVSIVSSLVL